MDLLEKFAAVKIEADSRITESDKDFCEQHQKAYETAISSFKELAFFWADMNTEQQKLLGGVDSPFYHNYLFSQNGPSISQDQINRHIEGLHQDYIDWLTHYFNSTYHVSVSSSEVAKAILPKQPESRRGDTEEWAQYHVQMQSLTVHYSDIVDQIILRLDGRSFSEQAFHELYTKCHNAAWNTYRQKAEFEQKKDTIRFTGYFCNFRGWPFDGWELQDTMKEILRGVAHYETGSYRVFPLGFSDLMGYHDIKDAVVEFPTCEKVKQIKLFKNNRVDLKFASPEFAGQFISKYLGTVC